MLLSGVSTSLCGVVGFRSRRLWCRLLQIQFSIFSDLKIFYGIESAWLVSGSLLCANHYFYLKLFFVWSGVEVVSSFYNLASRCGSESDFYSGKATLCCRRVHSFDFGCVVYVVL